MAKGKPTSKSIHPGTSKGDRSVDVREGRIARIERWGDGLDEDGEDAFELNRDKVTLDEADGDDQDLEVGDEVMRLDVESESEFGSEGDGFGSGAEGDGDGLPLEKKRKKTSDNDRIPASKTGTSRLFRPDPTEQDTINVGHYSDEADSSEEDTGWRGSYHISKSNDAEPDSEDEDMVQSQVEEAMRLQRLHKSRLAESDFGIAKPTLSSKDAAQTRARAYEDDQAVPEGKPAMDRDHAIAHLVDQSPEILAILDDFRDVAEDLPQSITELEKAGTGLKSGTYFQAFAWLYHQSMVHYLSLAAFLLHLRSRTDRSPETEEIEVRVLKRIVGIRTAMSVLQQEGVGLPDVTAQEGHAEDELDDESDILDDEDEVDYMSAENLIESVLVKEPSSAEKKRKRKRRTTRPSTEGGTAADDVQVGKKRRRAIEPDDDLEDLDIPVVRKSTAKDSGEGLEFVEATSLSAHEADDKAQKKRSLRFYTAKIDSKSSKRATATALRGGDDDIPYRSRERSRQAVTQRKNDAVADNVWNQDEDVGGADDDFYDAVKRSKAEALAEKKAAYEASTLLDVEGGDDPISGPRAANRTMLANRGLTPKRAKANRNPRVKKRLRYDKAMKKVASMKPTYKGGLSSGQAYSGESTGISKRTVKSVKF